MPRLILLDLKLPHVLGSDVLEWIRSNPNLQTLPLVILTSSGEWADLERAYRLGANSFVVKPSHSEDLVNLARCIKDYWFKFSVFPLQTWVLGASPRRARQYEKKRASYPQLLLAQDGALSNVSGRCRARHVIDAAKIRAASSSAMLSTAPNL